jgi:hypothetical protein
MAQEEIDEMELAFPPVSEMRRRRRRRRRRSRESPI